MSNLTNNSTTKFIVGRTYSMTSACDSNCVWTFTVTRRTAKTVWLEDDEGKILQRRVDVYENEENLSPFGSYSMAPSLRAARPNAPAAQIIPINAHADMIERMCQ